MSRTWLLIGVFVGALVIVLAALIGVNPPVPELSADSDSVIVAVSGGVASPAVSSRIGEVSGQAAAAQEVFDLADLESRLNQPGTDDIAAVTRFFGDLPTLISSGAVDRIALVELAEERYLLGSQADLNFVLRVAVETGDVGLVSRLLGDAESYDEQFVRNMEIELSRLEIADDADVSPLLNFVESHPGNTLSKAVSHALVASGQPAVGDWLILRLQSASGAQEKRMLLNTIESLKAGSQAVYQLVRVADSVTDDVTQKAVIYGLGRVGGAASFEYLMQRVAADPALRPLVVEAVSKSGSEQAWAQVQKEMLFSEDVPRRVLATESYLKGFASWDSEAVNNTATKILANSQDFPIEMVQLAELYLQNQQPGS